PAPWVARLWIGGHEQTRFRSPWAWSIRPTGDQYLSGVGPYGYAACSRLYACGHSSAISTAVCGAPRSGLFSADHRPLATSSISARIDAIASQKRSISARSSDSVGSNISVPGTGNAIVGAWNP